MSVYVVNTSYCPVCDSHGGGHRLSCPTLGVVPVLDLEPNRKTLELTAMNATLIEPQVRTDYDVNFLSRNFEKAMTRLYPSKDWKTIFWSLNECYESSTRYYHDWSHIQTMVEVLDFLDAESAGRLTEDQKALLLLAIFFHDAHMQFGRNDNEERSIYFMSNALMDDTNTSAFNALTAMIMATKHDTRETDFLTQILLDIDLWGLGDPDPDRFVGTTARIRAEYAFVQDTEFMRGRVAWMASMMEGHKGIFYNPMMVNSLLARETAASVNMSTSRQRYEAVLEEFSLLNMYMPKSGFRASLIPAKEARS